MGIVSLLMNVALAQGSAFCLPAYYADEPSVSSEGIFTAKRQVICATPKNNFSTSFVKTPSGAITYWRTNVAVDAHRAFITVDVVGEKPWYMPTWFFKYIILRQFESQFENTKLNLIKTLNLE